jgi:pSer/pThr/pTyr-binding forkhead associated (FHA) protein
MDNNGNKVIVQLGENPLTIGRSNEADIVLDEGDVSRVHCAIRKWDDDYIIKDMKSENGISVNGKPVDVARLEAGDKITVGSFSIFFEKNSRRQPGPNTVMKNIGREIMEGHKGYSTMLVELVAEAQKK